MEVYIDIMWAAVTRSTCMGSGMRMARISVFDSAFIPAFSQFSGHAAASPHLSISSLCLHLIQPHIGNFWTVLGSIASLCTTFEPNGVYRHEVNCYKQISIYGSIYTLIQGPRISDVDCLAVSYGVAWKLSSTSTIPGYTRPFNLAMCNAQQGFTAPTRSVYSVGCDL